ncbi:hypothetical protein [Lactiplantibacillus plantarum]|nr:hypothetical protein [Lactiplantibacillus plantarum]UZM89331.1 hypothetical protein OP868_15200 [Lactiplantibacillus plantarum]
MRWIARLLKRYPTTTSRELRRCTLRRSIFLVATERLYYQCKHTCG